MSSSWLSRPVFCRRCVAARVAEGSVATRTVLTTTAGPHHDDDQQDHDDHDDPRHFHPAWYAGIRGRVSHVRVRFCRVRL